MKKQTDPASPAVRREREFRRRAFPNATAADWNDWRWQLAQRIRSPAKLERLLDLSPRERQALARPATWRLPLGLTPYLLALLAAEPPGGPLRRTLLPDVREARHAPGESRDPLGEVAHQVAPGLIRAYPHKVLWLVTNECAGYCRFCTRARTAGKTLNHRTDPFCFSLGEARALAWLRRNPAIRDVLVSGGDPLTQEDAWLERRLRALRDIPHVELIRVGTRIPAVLPQRVTPALARLLRRYRPLWLSLHFTHPAELTPRAAAACRRLLDAGLPLMNQTVLLRGVNDDRATLQRLNEGLLRLGVKPYYLHQGDLAAGTAHLRSTVAKGRAILRALCGRTSGYAMPLFMFDRPGGGGKVPLGPVFRTMEKSFVDFPDHGKNLSGAGKSGFRGRSPAGPA